MWTALVLVTLTCAVYAPVRNMEFLLYDDEAYVASNPRVNQGLSAESVRSALTEPTHGNWHPVTMLSHLVDVELYGLKPGGHHLTSLLIHAANGVLLYLFLAWVTGRRWPPAFAAAFFAVHPLHVQSVAWIAERKNVLSTLFWLLALLAYLRFLRRPGWKRYGLVFLAFLLGLASKPMVVTLPITLLLLDYLFRERRPGEGPAPWASLGRWTLEKTPMFLAAAACGILTVRAQASGGAMWTEESLDLTARASNALVAYAWYLGKTIWPSALSVFYTHHLGGTGAGILLLSAATLTAISALALWKRREHPTLLVGWLWYLTTLVPVIGLLQVGGQARADRYAYVPMIGILIAASGVAGTLLSDARRGTRISAAIAAAAAIAALGVVTAHDLEYWHDSVSLFRRAVELDDENAIAQSNLGVALAREQRFANALPHFRRAVELRPGSAGNRLNLANALSRVGRREEARQEYEIAAGLDPSDPRIHYNLALLLEQEGDIAGAGELLRRALKLDPGYRKAELALRRLRDGRRKKEGAR